MAKSSDRKVRVVPVLVIGGAAWFAMQELGSLILGAAINWPQAAATAVFGLCVLVALMNLLTFIANFFDLIRALTPRGNKGTASWAKSLRSVCGYLLGTGFGPYWGVFAIGGLFSGRGKGIFADYESNAVTFGTAGSGKGIGVVLPTCLAILGPKILPDFKGVNTCCLKAPLEARGERLCVLNIGGMHTAIIGDGEYYNPLDIITDNFTSPGGLQNITGDCEELCLQIYPEPSDNGGKGDDRFWRDGGRDFISFFIQQNILVHENAATLGEIALSLGDRAQMLKEALWVAGRLKDENGNPIPAMPFEQSPWVKYHFEEDVKNYISYHRSRANSIADLLLTPDSKTADSFLAGARLALAPYNITTRAHKMMSKSTFRFRELKESDQVITVTIVIDASRKETQTRIAALLQWCAFTELKRCDNKRRKVYFICDETTNFKIHDLPGLQTWGREYGLVWHGFIQSISAYRATYGKEAVSTLLSETSIKQFLPGQRDPEMLKLIAKLLAEQSIITVSHNGKRDQFGVPGFGYREDARPLMTEDEIRRTGYTILFIGPNRPLLTTLPPISSIDPWRTQIGINPFFGKPFLQRVTLRIGHRKGNFLIRLRNWLSAVRSAGDTA